ncbi:MAG: tetratricopeptide repeat protein [Pirellulaceae bacterium]
MNHQQMKTILEQTADDCVSQRRWIDALRSLDRIVAIGMADAITWQKMGSALLQVKEYAQAKEALANALKLDNTNATTHHLLAKAQFTLGETDEAVAHLLQAHSLNSSAIESLQSAAHIIANAPSATNQDVLEIRREFAKRLPLNRPQSHDSKQLGNAKPIRIAFLSAHFRLRNYMKPVWGLLNHLDRTRFQVVLLDDGQGESEFVGYRTNACDQIHSVRNQSDMQLAQTLEDLRIDVLVDLSSYSYPQRLSLFQQPLAPVTIGWFNAFATSGLPGFDYILGDSHVIPQEEEAFYSERVIRLESSYLTFQVDYPVPPVAASPCLQSQRFTFGSLVSQYKITSVVLDAWSQILQQAPNTELIIANGDMKSPHNQAYLRQQFANLSVDAYRIRLLPPADHDTFLKYYDLIDLALDAFPYNGGTTTMEALWQGVPVLTKNGDRWAARTSQTLLRECHLSDFVAKSVDEYVRVAVHWSQPSRWDALAELRAQMRTALSASSVCNCAEMAKQFGQQIGSLLK